MSLDALALLMFLDAAAAFNIAAHHAVVIPSPASSHGLFGYSVALVAGRSTPAQMLVGEPRGQWAHHQEVHHPGTLYRCLLTGIAPRCAPAVLDQTGNEPAHIGGHFVVHLKNDSMFASTILTAPSGLALVCGPGWKNQLFSYKHYLMNGLCYQLDWKKHDSKPTPIAPLVDKEKQGITVRDPNDGEHFNKAVFYYAFGEAGFSAFVTQDGKEVILGAPGVFNWRGTVIRYRLDERGALINQMTPQPSRSDRFEDFGYFGYSVSAGRFLSGLGNRVQYAAGAPRAANTGKVLLFDLPTEGTEEPTMSVLQELGGHQFGEYFGAALLAEDVTGDGLADLVVGAPLHSSTQHGDAGRVYVYVNLGEGRLQLTAENQLSSRQTGARFGSALAALGDINKDGFMDILVGAPYEDSGRGAVYVLLGAAGGLRGPWSQRIAAKDLDIGLRAFGASLSASADVDDNGYSDVGVGAPLSGHAVLLLTRPAARLTATLTPSTGELSFSTTSFVVSACVKYTGYRAEPVAAAWITLWVEGSTDRALIMQPGQLRGGELQRQLRYRQVLHIGKHNCDNVTVVIRPSGLDYTAPIDLGMRFALEGEAEGGKGRPFCKACPVQDPAEARTQTLRVPYATGCQDDRTCRPDLRIHPQWQDIKLPVVLGAVREAALLVAVHNLGEPAYVCRLAVTLPAPLSVARLPAACHATPAPAATRSSRLLCDLANPLGHNQKQELLLHLGLAALTLDALPKQSTLEVLLNATSAGEEVQPLDNVARVGLPVTAQVDLAIVGRASPELGLLPEEAGAKAVGFTHTYEVRSVGPTSVQGAQLRLLVPAKAHDGSRVVQVLTAHILVDKLRVACVSKDADVDATSGDFLGAEDLPDEARQSEAEDWEDVEEGDGLSCGSHPAVCVEMSCPLGALDRGVTLAFRGRLAIQAVGAVLGPYRPVVVRTRASVVVPGLRGALPPGSTYRTSPFQLSTVFLRPAAPAAVQPWVVVLAVLAGLLLLLLLSLALWKAGFFGRKKLPEQCPHPDAHSQAEGDASLLTSEKIARDATQVETDEDVQGILGKDGSDGRICSSGAPERKSWQGSG